MHRALLYVGVAFVLVGAMLAIVPTASFSTIAGDRPVDISIADDSEAFVAIDSTDTGVTQPGNGVAVAALVNNLGSPMTVEYEASVDAEPVTVEDPTETVTIERGETAPIRVVCAPPEGGSGTATLTINVIEARSGTTTVSDATLSTSFDYDCPGGGPGGPSGPPGGAVAYVDANQNGEYDGGERTVSTDELAEFDDDSAHLVIASGGERIDFRNREVDIEARSIAVGETTLASNRAIAMAAGELSLHGSTVDTQNGEIGLEAGTITADDSTITSNREISVSADGGPVTLGESRVESQNGEIVVEGGSVIAPRATFTSNLPIEIVGESGPLTLPDATIDSSNGEIELAGRSIDATGIDISTNVAITVVSESGAIRVSDGTIESSNGEIVVESADSLGADGAAFSTNVAIELEASGDVDLDAARLASSNGQATVELNRGSATLSVGGAVIADRDSTLTYSPGGVTVSGTPDRGSVQRG
ncbi:hypothetical protein [Halobellus salinisoli]|uniref:hypothetical protein n=1 Tax=Halobellus salinisoli TaxID=3108500 RepID=UPI00300B3FDF